ncbi:glycine betaine ABC transporter substrate-binding protein [Clostridium botulinum]|uniref:ABC transporter permease/substrate-binding protein n=1 Tax=Clostridium botulinum TaxID=1491 RepID=UPI000585ECCA|nr:glycine betaine ABC transporter substrate-binding protein [Clostridium botulinum]AJD27301.1 binding--dependent transport system inner membrane component family protein [Clostridium botulinum CDC_297]APU60573.1 binding--dependent transport system inner membrane component family protein [Clostridium botulinum]AUN03199.1 ABC transporter permease [Clostridium botulinum]MBN3397284.1 ABC transporter permease [Clostridium botulinum]MBN3412895.1 ABC transporter permease [Clostridium botulinum]
MNSFIEQLILKKSQILSLLVEHVELTLISVLVAVAIGVPLGIIITKNKKLAKTVIGFANLTQAIPSLAILGFLIPLIGIGSAPAITMVVLYSMLPILKNTYTGITNINPDMLEAAKGLGMTNTQTLKLIKIPLAMPIIMAGIRIASVTAVGLMTIAAFIGAGGLGYLVFSGIQTVDNNLILFGAIPAAILALVIDWVTGKIEDATMPNGIKKADGTMKIKRSSSNKNRKRNTIITSIVGVCILLALVAPKILGMGHKKVVIGSKNFTEQLILGNILEELIKDKTDIDVETKLNLGGTQVSFNALKSGGIDMYVEYTGTAYGNILNIKEPNRDKDTVYNKVKKDFKEKFRIEVLNPMGFNNTYAMATTKEIAQKYNLKTTSDLAKESSNMIAGPTIEFANREDGLIGLNKAYNVNFKGVNPIDGGLRYTALVNNETQIIDAFTTDGLIEQFNLVLLEDDKRFFPDYYAVPIVKEETLKKFPELREVLGNLDGRITDEKMRKLNYEVDVNKKDPKQVAKEFLQKEGLID